MHPKHTTFSLLFSLLPLSATASAQEPATKADLQALELKLTNQMTEMGKRLTGQIAALNKRLTQQITELDSRLTKQIHELDRQIIGLDIVVRKLDKRLTTRIDVLFWAMSALIGIVLAVIAFKF